MPRLLPARTLRAASALFAVVAAAACQSGPFAEPADEAAPAPPSGPTPSIDWAGAPDCLGRLRLLERAAHSDRLPEDPDAVPIAVRVVPTSGDWLTAADPDTAWIQADLPLRILTPHPRPGHDVGCWIEVGPARDLAAELAEVGTEPVRSAYQSGSKSERNPEYELAELRVRQAEKDIKEGAAGIITVGDPMLDLVGLMVGSVVDAFSGRARRGELEEALSTLAATQRSLERPVWRHYHFERTLFRGRKTALIPIALRGPHGSERRTLIRQRERRTFEMLDGLDPRDRDYEAHDTASMSGLELERWKQRPPTVPVSALVRALIDPAAPPESDPGPVPDVPEPLDSGPQEPTVVAEQGTEPPPSDAGRRASPDAARAAAQRPRAERTEVASLEALKGDPPPRAVPIAVPKPPGLPVRSEPDAAAGHPVPDVVTLRRGDADLGIGVYLSPHTVLTTARVVGDAQVLEARLGGALLPALVAARDPARDLALVRLPRAGRSAPLDGDPTLAAPVSLLAAGSPATESPTSIADLPGDATRLRLALAPATTPPLGAPVLSEGRLIGIVTAVDGSTAVAASGRTIQALLDRLPDVDLLLD